MDQLTVRGLDDDLRRRVREVSHERGVSLNKAASYLIRKGAGLLDPRANVAAVGDALDDLIGSWSDQEARDVHDAVDVFERVAESP